MRTTLATLVGGLGLILFLFLSWFALLTLPQAGLVFWWSLVRLFYGSSRPGCHSSLVQPGTGHADVGDVPTFFGEWLPTLGEMFATSSHCEMWFDAVHVKSPSAGGFDGWAWNGLRALALLQKNLGIGLFTCFMPISS